MSELSSHSTRIVPALRPRPVPLAALFAWGLAIAVGCVFSFRFANTPSTIDAGAVAWPPETACRHSTNRPTLLMFVHPRCPCSRASLDELARLMTHCPGRVHAEVVFFVPSSAPADWAHTDLWESAARIAGVMVRSDRGGTEQRRFAARVSGEVFLYETDGSLAFHGGITGGRGHVGDNAGRSALEALLVNQRPPMRTTPVFGCALEARSDPAMEGAANNARTNR